MSAHKFGTVSRLMNFKNDFSTAMDLVLSYYKLSYQDQEKLADITISVSTTHLGVPERQPGSLRG